MTGTATVEQAITLKTATAVERPASATAVAAPTIISRFFGFTDESNSPSPAALTGVTWSIAAIHLGSATGAPFFGRLRHWRTPSSSRSTPRTILIHEEVVDGPSLVSNPTASATSSRIVIPSTTPATQPTRKPTLVPPARGERSIRITAMIGTGLIATPTARGSR